MAKIKVTIKFNGPVIAKPGLRGEVITQEVVVLDHDRRIDYKTGETIVTARTATQKCVRAIDDVVQDVLKQRTAAFYSKEGHFGHGEIRTGKLTNEVQTIQCERVWVDAEIV